jgi:histidine ammonia-lyase
VIELDGRSLTSSDIVSVAHQRDSVTLSPAARRRIVSSHERAETLLSQRPMYGRSTGVGANRDTVVHDPDQHARSILRSHATSAGAPRAPERVRAMLAVRINQLAAGGSGASPELAEALLAMLEVDALPLIREHGGIGTGDLTALAMVGLALIGEAPTSAPLGIRTQLGVHDALPLLSSNAAALGDAAIACTQLSALARAYVVVAALTFTAIGGNAEAFAEAISKVTPFVGAERSAAWMRALVDPLAVPTRLQDPVSLRAVPQTHGVFVDAVDSLDEVVARLANAPSENPLIMGTAANDEGVMHHGGFHAAYLTAALTAATTAAAQTAKLSLRRLALLNEPVFTGLQPFLADAERGSSGVMMLEYVAASALGDLLVAATPVGSHITVLSRGVEDDASFASLAARQAMRAVDNLEIVIACEAVAAARALGAHPRIRTPALLQRAVDLCLQAPHDLVDRDLSADIAAIRERLGTLADLISRGQPTASN